MNPTSVTSVDAKHALAILHQLAMMEVGPTRGNEELLAGLASIENSLCAVVDTPPATLSLPPLTPSAQALTPWLTYQLKGSSKLDEGGVCTSKPPQDFALDQWWETMKEQLGLMAHLQDIAPYHDQEQDSELLKVVPQGWEQAQLTVMSLIKVGVELLEVLEDVLGWLDLWVLEGYKSLEAVPLLTLQAFPNFSSENILKKWREEILFYVG
ncbi:hypothetical protein EDD16DRAFT_1702011 [Pisolithus croceorrhizus]|nr:hypothetical protein EDD16DRAFT_1702011 [Pisolithus croceorrhizus]